MELVPTIVKIWRKVCLNVLKNLIVKNIALNGINECFLLKINEKDIRNIKKFFKSSSTILDILRNYSCQLYLYKIFLLRLFVVIKRYIQKLQ